MNTDPKKQRKVRLIKPGLQFRLIMTLTIVAALTLLLQSLLLAQRLSWMVTRLPVGGDYLSQEIPSLLLNILAISMAVLLPLAFAMGILTTFRFAGPIHRFENYFKELRKGNDPGPMRLRDSDQLQELSDLINECRDQHWSGAQVPQAGSADQDGSELPSEDLRKAS